MVRMGDARSVLVVGVERMTDIVDPADRSIAFLFADGAGAVVVGPVGASRNLPHDPPAPTGVPRRIADDHSWGDFRVNPELPLPMMKMDGRRVFRWAMENLVPAARTALDVAGLDAADLAAFVAAPGEPANDRTARRVDYRRRPSSRGT